MQSQTRLASLFVATSILCAGCGLEEGPATGASAAEIAPTPTASAACAPQSCPERTCETGTWIQSWCQCSYGPVADCTPGEDQYSAGVCWQGSLRHNQECDPNKCPPKPCQVGFRHFFDIVDCSYESAADGTACTEDGMNGRCVAGACVRLL
jgi:hypothetical protein